MLLSTTVNLVCTHTQTNTVASSEHSALIKTL